LVLNHNAELAALKAENEALRGKIDELSNLADRVQRLEAALKRQPSESK
jgi:cell division protein FtsB